MRQCVFNTPSRNHGCDGPRTFVRVGVFHLRFIAGRSSRPVVFDSSPADDLASEAAGEFHNWKGI
jgi:hypothetical protein